MKRNPYSARVNPAADGLKSMSAAITASFNNVRQGQPLPTRMKVLPWGETRTTDGDVMRVDERTAAVLPEMQRRLNWPHAHIDIEHATVPGTPLFERAAKAGSFAAVLGWGAPKVIPGEGLFVDGIVWTPQSKRAYEFPDLSGVVKHDPDGTVTALHSFAFCCHGKGEGVTAYSALIDSNATTEEQMDKLLLALLGVTEDADDQTKMDAAVKIGAALQSLIASGPDGAKAMSELLKLEPAKLKALSALDAGKLAALSQLSAEDLGAKLKTLSQLDEGHGAAMTALGKRVEKVEGDLKPMAQDFAAMRRADLLAKAAAKGKVVPQGWVDKYGSDLAVLSDMIDGLPEGVAPLSQMSAPGGHPAPTRDAPEAAQVAKIFGRKPEDLKGIQV